MVQFRWIGQYVDELAIDRIEYPPNAPDVKSSKIDQCNACYALSQINETVVRKEILPVEPSQNQRTESSKRHFDIASEKTSAMERYLA